MIKLLNLAILLTALMTTSQMASAQSVDNSALDTAPAPLAAADLLRDKEAGQVDAGPVGLEPFGARLFRGGFSIDREDGINPNYLIQPGDRVSVRIWGATDFNDSLIVDNQGNIFIPTVGPIPLRGVRNSQLNTRVSRAVATVFSDNVKVYTSLDAAQPVAVFVTGYVPNPGRFSGIPSTSVLYFLDRAGGIDGERGSYRHISVRREGKVIADVDLYDFLQKGELVPVQFRDGDTIVVGPRGSSIAITGDASNEGIFEFSGDSMTGAEAIELAMLAPGVSYVGLSGIRDDVPVSSYLQLDEFRQVPLYDGDQVHFRVDQNESVIVVEVEGEHLGPSRYAVPSNTRLQELLDYIEVDNNLASVKDVSLKRKQIALRQESALHESLSRLQSRYLTASSQTDAESAIRAREAELISKFVKRARGVKPNGRLVVARNGKVADVMLQSGDTVTIPARSESVLLSGEVLVSQALLFEPGRKARNYITQSGGFSEQANKKRIVVVHANGEVSSGANPAVKAGDEILVLPKVPVKNLQLAATIVDILYKVAVSAAVAINL